MAKRILVVIMAIVAMGLMVGVAFGQSSKDTYKALKKLQARTETGISFKDYGPALGDAKVEVNMFLESAEAKQKPRLKEIFTKTMKHYEEAGNVWRYQFAGRGAPACMVTPDDSAMIDQILRYYPSVRTKVESLDTYESVTFDDAMRGKKRPVHRDRLRYLDAIKAIWQEASNELQKAGPLLN